MARTRQTARRSPAPGTAAFSASVPATVGVLKNGKDYICRAASNNSTANRLFDDDLSTYWQSNASCPHKITITMTPPRILDRVGVHTDMSDSSYTPERLSLEVTYRDGSTDRNEYDTEASTGWHILSFSPRVVSSFTVAVERNRQGGCDTRVRQIALIADNGDTVTLNPALHAALMQRDIFRLSPEATVAARKAAETDNSDREYAEELTACELVAKACPPDLLVRVGDQTFPAHRLVLASRSQLLAGMLIADPTAKEICLSEFEAGDVADFIYYAYSGECSRILHRLGLVPTEQLTGEGRAGKLTAPKSEAAVEAMLGPAASLFRLASKLGCPALSELCESLLSARISRDTLSEVLITWVDAHGSGRLRAQVHAVLVDNIDLAVQNGWHRALPRSALEGAFEALVKQASAVEETAAPATPPSWVPAADQTIRAGLSVRVLASVDTPSFGWGSVNHTQVGTVASEPTGSGSDLQCNVDFPSQSGWTAKVSELEVVEKPKPVAVAAAEAAVDTGIPDFVSALSDHAPQTWSFVA
jgi:hypothetical protein